MWWQRAPPPPPPEPTNPVGETALLIIGLFPALAVVWSVGTRSKTVAALAQLGGLHARDSLAEHRPEAPEARAARQSVKVHDQACFTVGVLNVGLTTYLLGAVPHLFYLWHTPKAMLLTAVRWWTFRREGKHFLLLDFCYWVNGVGLVYLWVYPDHAQLFQVFFMLANGPLAWSVLTFSQSLVFHSHAHMTSVFIHVSPMLLSHALRWSANGATNPPQFAVCDGGCDVGPFTLWSRAILRVYIPWVCGYYAMVFLMMGDYLKRRNYQTLFDRVVSQGAAAKVMNRAFKATGASHGLTQRLVFMCTHLLFGLVTTALAAIHWHSFVAHTAFALAICGASTWNASSYYFSHFASTYETSVDQRISRASAMSERRSSSDNN